MTQYVNLNWLVDIDPLWTCELALKTSDTQCEGDASAYGSVATSFDAAGTLKITGVRTMKTDTVYDKIFCTRCKITDTFLQSPFFRVNVVNSCTAESCIAGTSKGKFVDY